jgi:hypothetical protein
LASHGGLNLAMAGHKLTPDQLHSLFDILTHYETYREVEEFKLPTTVANYGHPFVTNGDDGAGGGEEPAPAEKSGSPILQLLLRQFVLTLPGIAKLDADFWRVRVQGMLTTLAKAHLSESYDKGALGTRKTLATAASAIIEAVARGVLGGYPGRSRPTATAAGKTDQDAQRLVQAWEHTIRNLIKGDLVDGVFSWLEKSDDLEAHSEDVKGAIDYCIIQ